MNPPLKRELILRQLYDAAIYSVDGYHATALAVKTAVAKNGESLALDRPVQLIALGKAAAAMALGGISILGDKIVNGLVVTKHGHLSEKLSNDSRFTTIESGHPTPDEFSLNAGAILVDTVQNIPHNHQLLLLISGGASALVEHLIEPNTLSDLAKLTERLLADGHSIGDINRQRQKISQIKGGKLAHFLSNVPVTQYLISDVPGDVAGDIGSGLLVPKLGAKGPT